jgi:hypothetical protein
MSNELEAKMQNLPAEYQDEAAQASSFLAAASSTRPPLVKFRKGHFYLGDVEIPIGTQFVAHMSGWRRGWRKWRDNEVIVDHMVLIIDDHREPLERNELDDLDPEYWPPNDDGERLDPWSLESQLPLERVETGELLLFTTSSFGGRLAVEILAQKYARSITRGLPTIKLGVGEFSTKKYGRVARPDFQITSWESDVRPASVAPGGGRDGGMIDVTPSKASAEEPPWPEDGDFH